MLYLWCFPTCCRETCKCVNLNFPCPLRQNVHNVSVFVGVTLSRGSITMTRQSVLRFFNFKPGFLSGNNTSSVLHWQGQCGLKKLWLERDYLHRDAVCGYFGWIFHAAFPHLRTSTFCHIHLCQNHLSFIAQTTEYVSLSDIAMMWLDVSAGVEDRLIRPLLKDI